MWLPPDHFQTWRSRSGTNCYMFQFFTMSLWEKVVTSVSLRLSWPRHAAVALSASDCNGSHCFIISVLTTRDNYGMSGSPVGSMDKAICGVFLFGWYNLLLRGRWSGIGVSWCYEWLSRSLCLINIQTSVPEVHHMRLTINLLITLNNLNLSWSLSYGPQVMNRRKIIIRNIT